MIDAHCHLADPRIAELSQVMARAHKSGIEAMVSCGLGAQTWPQLTACAQQFSEIAPAYGLHPWAVPEDHGELTAALESLEGVAPKGIALGEIGLDRSRLAPASSQPLQVEALRAQLAIARELDLPIVIHELRAAAELQGLLRADGLPKAGGMVHAFGGSAEVMRGYLQLGLMISLGGGLTRPNARKLRRAAAELPLDRLLFESDAPDQPPWGYEMPNEPANLWQSIGTMAKIRGLPMAQLAEHARANALELFGPALLR